MKKRRLTIYEVVECVSVVYVLLTSIINFVNVVGVVNVDGGFMKNTFWGPSLLTLMLLQYGFITINKDVFYLASVRPYVMGIMMANIISLGDVSLMLMLGLLIGYFLFTGFKTKFGTKEIILTVLVACVCFGVLKSVLVLRGITDILQ